MKRRVPFPRFQLDRASREPLHTQLARAIRHSIDAGDLPPGAALPSSRALATSLGISRNTVITAYDELAADSRIAAQRGSATLVATPARPRRGFDYRAVVRASQYPVDAVAFRDPDGSALYFHR